MHEITWHAGLRDRNEQATDRISIAQLLEEPRDLYAQNPVHTIEKIIVFEHPHDRMIYAKRVKPASGTLGLMASLMLSNQGDEAHRPMRGCPSHNKTQMHP